MKMTCINQNENLFLIKNFPKKKNLDFVTKRKNESLKNTIKELKENMKKRIDHNHTVNNQSRTFRASIMKLPVLNPSHKLSGSPVKPSMR